MDVNSKVKKVLDSIEKAGFEVAVVGGTARDLLAHQEPSDWDLATNAKPQEILKLFKGAFYNNVFGTVGLTVDSTKVEVTTYRTESSYSDMRHPDSVRWGKSLEEDLSRRDFTINAIAIPYKSGTLSQTAVDPFEGESDFKNKILRAVGDPDKRFGEDALRMLRAVRFATALGFEIEKGTFDALVRNSALISNVSGERIREELFKIIASENAADGIFLARDAGILKIILPELDECFSVEQKSPKRHHVYDVGTHCVLSLKHCPSKDVVVRFATLLHDVGKAKVAKVTEEGVRTFYNHEVVGGRIVLGIAKRLNLSKEQREKLFKLVRWHQFSVSEEQTDKALRRFIKNIGIENIEDMMDLRIGDRLGGGLQQPESWRLKLFRKRLKDVLKKPFTVSDLKVNGRDVMDILGMRPGPRVGKILAELFEEVAADNKKNNKDFLLQRIRDFK
jgi:tRNA nucleotidyltransferase/poly(A) polymerase